jgi:hypothetical protein
VLEHGVRWGLHACPGEAQVEEWRQVQITDERAKLILYSAFVDGKLEASRSLLSEVHRLYFQPQY